MTTPKTVMIWGVTGQIGSYLAEEMLGAGYNVVGIKRRNSLLGTDRVNHLYTNPKFKLEYGNLCDTSSIYSLLTKHNPDIIQNCAAQSHVRVSFDLSEETWDVTAGGVLRLLNAVRAVCPRSKVFQCSSSEMFGRNTQVPQRETTLMIPASPYAVAKHAAHELCRNYRDGYGLNVSCGILFNTESPRRLETFVTRKITQAVARMRVGLQTHVTLGNLDAKRDWTFAGDTVRAIRMISEHNPPEDFVVASGTTHTVREFLQEVLTCANIKGPVDSRVKFDPRLLRPEEVPVLQGDSSKIRRTLGWEPTYSFQDLCALMYQHDLARVRLGE